MSIILKIQLTTIENVLLIIKAGTLNTNSKIRKFFENSKFHLALACYEEDIKSKCLT